MTVKSLIRPISDKGYRNPTPNPLSGVFPWILEPQRLGL